MKIINHALVKDEYVYSDNELIHNGKVIDSKNNEIKLRYLIKMASSWQDSVRSSLDNGFFVSIDFENQYKEYLFSNSVPNNFKEFVYEVKEMVGNN
jgi:hypothetical protein